VQPAPRPSDTLSVNELAWTFVRGDKDKEHLTIVRGAGEGPDGVRLMITVDGATRSFDFTDVMAAVRFQCDMEAFLVRSGWSFIAFAPEHRTNRDRRSFPRLRERRRWWTDGTVSLKQFLDRDDFRWPAEPPAGGRKRDGG
jgi:hypothetical protein